MAGVGGDKPKVMDAVHPRTAVPGPSSSSRPIIVTNHSYIKNDPMLSAQDDAKSEPAQEEPVVELSTSEIAEQAAPADEPKSPKIQLLGEKKIQPLSAADKEALESSETSVSESDASEKQEPAKEPKEKPAPEPEKPDFMNVQLPPQAVPDEAEQKERDKEIERIIAAGTYAVPLNRKKRRRTWITWTIVITVLVIIIGLDVLADMGVFELPFGIPSTDFFVK